MRNASLLLVLVTITLSACAPRGYLDNRKREAREYPDLTLGTDNSEAETYKTQIIASPSAPPAATDTGAAVPKAGPKAKLPESAPVRAEKLIK